jgi:hypothetical protein
MSERKGWETWEGREGEKGESGGVSTITFAKWD